MPTLAALLDLRNSHIEEVSFQEERVVLVLLPQGRAARCPLCRRPSHRIYSS
ncbi:MAG TPA: hypothetical protein VGN26_12110 [Armatimonadota bacterium]|jgi:hypothetical protein